MKKLSALFVALVMASAIHAQFALQKMKAGETVTPAAGSRAAITPGENQAWWGYVGAEEELGGVGVRAAETYHCAIFIPGNHLVAGGKTIHAIRFALPSQNSKDAKVWIASSLPATVNEANTIQLVEVPDNQRGYSMDIALPAPYAIPASGVYVGYTFTITKTTYTNDAYPVMTTGLDNANSLWLRTSSSVKTWSNLNGQGFGSLYLQALLEGTFVDNMAMPANFGPVYTKCGETVAASVPITNEGPSNITSFDYTVTTDGVESAEQRITLSAPIPFCSTRLVLVPITGDAAQAVKQKSFTITRVNGYDNQDTKKSSNFTLYSLAEIIERNVAVEEYTGTGCGWCPRGLVGMQKLRKKFGDRFVGIGVHRYNTSDAMYISNYAPLSFSGAPECTLDRKKNTDPFYGDNDDICNDFQTMMEIPAMASVQVSGNLDESTAKVDAQATVKVLFADDYKLEFVLIADGLTGEGDAWNQSNYYYQYNSSQLDEDLAQFGKGGKYGTSSISGWSFDDVAISTSYSGSSSQIPGFSLADGESKEITYSLSMPTKASLKAAINNDKLYIAALLVGKDKTIVNAAKAKVTVGASSITTHRSDNTDTEACYTLDGRRVNTPQKGLNIVRTADGRTVKVAIK